MNSQSEFADYLRLMRQAALEESRTDDFKFENPEHSDDERESAETIIMGEEFAFETRQ